eukprot:scaffold703_cov168-Amphora_coffeaeformis.AAC.7
MRPLPQIGPVEGLLLFVVFTLWHMRTTTAFLRKGLVSTPFTQRIRPLKSRSETAGAVLSEKRSQQGITTLDDSSALLMAGRQTSTRRSTVKQKRFRRPRSIALVPLDEEEEEVAPVVAEMASETVDDKVVSVVEKLSTHSHTNSPIETSNIQNLSLGTETAVEEIPETPVEASIQDELSIQENTKIPTATEEAGPSSLDSSDTDSVNVSIDAASLRTEESLFFARSLEATTMDETVEEIRSMTSSADEKNVVEIQNIREAHEVEKTIGIVDEGLSKSSPSDSLVAKVQTIAETPPLVGEEVIAMIIPAEEKESVAEVAILEKEEEEGGNDLALNPVPPKQTPPTSLLPRREWDANFICAQAFAAVDQHPILLFDGACNLCNGWVNFCLDYDVKASFRFASLQSKVGQSILIRDGRPPDERSDIILATPQETFSKSDAVLRVISQLEGLPILVRVAATITRFFFPSWLRNAVYKFVSVNRHMFGQSDGPTCRLDLDGEYFGRFIEDPELEFELYEDNLASESEEEVYVKRR